MSWLIDWLNDYGAYLIGENALHSHIHIIIIIIVFEMLTRDRYSCSVHKILVHVQCFFFFFNK